MLQTKSIWSRLMARTSPMQAVFKEHFLLYYTCISLVSIHDTVLAQ